MAPTVSWAGVGIFVGNRLLMIGAVDGLGLRGDVPSAIGMRLTMEHDSLRPGRTR